MPLIPGLFQVSVSVGREICFEISHHQRNNILRARAVLLHYNLVWITTGLKTQDVIIINTVQGYRINKHPCSKVSQPRLFTAYQLKHFNLSRTYIQCPKISEAAAAHASVDNEARFLRGFLCVHYGCVALARRRKYAVCDGDVPACHVGARTQLERVQVIQVSAYKKGKSVLVLRKSRLTNPNAENAAAY